MFALQNLTPPPHYAMPSGVKAVGATGMSIRSVIIVGFTLPRSAYQFGPMRKEPDAGIGPSQSLPSVVIEVGDSDSLTQLKIDARTWIEHMPEVS